MCVTVLFEDKDHSVDERREIIVGHSLKVGVLVVCFSAREGTVRIFSARAATKRERSDYEENIQS
ncbi:MAG: BrnT family toxin [Bryobacteraceae bacterium]